MSDEVYIVQSNMFRPYEDWGTESRVYRTLEDAQAAVAGSGEGNIGIGGGWNYGVTHTIIRDHFGGGNRERIDSTTYYFTEEDDDDQ